MLFINAVTILISFCFSLGSTQPHHLVEIVPSTDDNIPKSDSPAATENKLQPRNVAGVYWCDQPNFKGNCHWTQVSGGACHPYSAGAWSSFGPDHGITCAVYATDNCYITQGQRTGIEWPGKNTLGWYYNIDQDREWQPKSFRCHWKFETIWV